MLMNTEVDGNSAILVSKVHSTCCREGPDAARRGHLACLQSLHKQGRFLGFHDSGRAEAGEARKAQAWLAALAACDGRHPQVLQWLLAGGWPRAEAERFPWQFRDVADPSTLMWYTAGRSWLASPGVPVSKGGMHSKTCWPVDVTAINFSVHGEWSEMAELAGLCDPQSVAYRLYEDINGSISWGDGVCQDWFPQEFQMLWRACRSGNFALQQVIVEAGCRSRWVSVLAALTSQLQFLKFAIQQGCPCEGSTLIAAAAGGHADSFKHVLKTCIDLVGEAPCPVEWGDGCAGCGECSPHYFFLKRLYWDYELGRWDRAISLDVWIYLAAIAAAEKGHLEVLKRAMTQIGQAVMRMAFWASPASAAISHGRLSCLEFAQKHGCKPRSDSVEVALQTGRTDCVPYLISHGFKLCDSVLDLAAQGVHLGVLELAAARGEELEKLHVATGAAVGGQLASLRFALDQFELRHPGTLVTWAAGWGNVSSMRYLQEKGYRSVNRTLSAAVESGSLECVEYAFHITFKAREVFPAGCMENAARHSVALVQFLHERGCPWEEGTTTAAAQRGCLATLQYCHEHGCSWDGDVIEAAVFADSAMCLQYIHTHDCPPLPPHPRLAAYNLEVLQYAVENMGEWGTGLLHATSAYLQREDLYQHQFADWRLLMYMSKKKVALPHVLQCAVELRVARFEAVVSCFLLATRLADRRSPHAPMWAAMGRIPPVLLECITRLAHLRL